MRLIFVILAFILSIFILNSCSVVESSSGTRLPSAGEVVLDMNKGEVILYAVVQHPKGKPCIDNWGQRPQAFIGCKYFRGGDAKFADYFVFLVEAKTEEVYDALIKLGAKTKLHYTIKEGIKGRGLTPTTKPEDYLQGSSVVISVFWRDGEKWKQLPYDEFVKEKILVDSVEVVKPWTPHFVFHGSGAIHTTGTGCIACPCDCPGRIIADNRFPISNPKPIVRFDWTKAPPVGTVVYVRIRPVCNRD